MEQPQNVEQVEKMELPKPRSVEEKYEDIRQVFEKYQNVEKEQEEEEEDVNREQYPERKRFADRNREFAFQTDPSAEQLSKEQLKMRSEYYSELDHHCLPPEQQHAIVSIMELEGKWAVRIWSLHPTSKKAAREMEKIKQHNPYAAFLKMGIVDLARSKGTIWLPPVFQNETIVNSGNKQHADFMKKHMKAIYSTHVQVEDRRFNAMQQASDQSRLVKKFNSYLNKALNSCLEADYEHMEEALAEALSDLPEIKKDILETTVHPGNEKIEDLLVKSESIHPKLVKEFIDHRVAMDNLSFNTKEIRRRYFKLLDESENRWYLVALVESLTDTNTWSPVADEIIYRVDYANTAFRRSGEDSVKNPHQEETNPSETETAPSPSTSLQENDDEPIEMTIQEYEKQKDNLKGRNVILVEKLKMPKRDQREEEDRTCRMPLEENLDNLENQAKKQSGTNIRKPTPFSVFDESDYAALLSENRQKERETRRHQFTSNNDTQTPQNLDKQQKQSGSSQREKPTNFELLMQKRRQAREEKRSESSERSSSSSSSSETTPLVVSAKEYMEHHQGSNIDQVVIAEKLEPSGAQSTFVFPGRKKQESPSNIENLIMRLSQNQKPKSIKVYDIQY